MTLSLAPSSSEPGTLSGMALGAVAFALMTSVDTIFKVMSEHHPAYQLLFINGIFALVPVLLWAQLTGGVHVRLKTAHPFRHLARGSTSLMSSFAAIYAYSRLPLTDFYAIVFAGPLIVTAMSAFWLDEKVDRQRWIAIGAGFFGILIVANPFDSVHSSPILMMGRVAAIISILCYALSVIMIRRMRLGEQSLTFTFYGYCAALLIAGSLLIFQGAPALSAVDVLHLAMSGTLAGISTICLMAAWHKTPVSLVAPFQYTQIIWGSIAGYFLWAHVPSVRLVLGAIIVAGCGFYVIHQEMRLREHA